METMIIFLKRIKLAVFIVLFFSVFLPFSSCTRTVDKSRYEDVHPEKRPPLEVREVEDYETGKAVEKEVYVVKSVRWIMTDPELLKTDFWLLLFSFWWPLLLPLLVWLKFGERHSVLFAVVQILFSILAAINIYVKSTFLNTPEAGAWVSMTSNILIVLIVITETSFTHLKRA